MNALGTMKSVGAAELPFDGIKMVQMHLDLRYMIEDFIHGRSEAAPRIEEECSPECPLAQYLHNPGGRIRDLKLLDSTECVCKKFRMTATHALALANIGKMDAAKEYIAEGSGFEKVSERLQDNFVLLHLAIQGRDAA